MGWKHYFEGRSGMEGVSTMVTEFKGLLNDVNTIFFGGGHIPWSDILGRSWFGAFGRKIWGLPCRYKISEGNIDGESQIKNKG